MNLENHNDKIFTIRGMKVMLDSDVADALGTDTKELNKNAKRSPKWSFLREEGVEHSYRFQLTREEIQFLRSQKTIARWQNGTFNEFTHLPWAYTSKGCYHFGTSLRSEMANRMAMQLSWTFDEVVNHKDESVRQLAKTPAEILLQSAQQLVEQERILKEQSEKIENHEIRLNYMEAQVDTAPAEYFTVKGYASLHNIPVDLELAKYLGKRASHYSKQFDIKMGKAKNTEFGAVNTYHEQILKKVFEFEVKDFRKANAQLALNLNVNPSFTLR